MHHPILNRMLPGYLLIAAILVMGFLVAVTYSTGAGILNVGMGTPLKPSSPSIPVAAPISEDEANKLVWALPEVQAAAEQLRAQGSRPLTFAARKPAPSAVPGSAQADYMIAFGEDRDGHVTTLDTFAVDAYTKEISVYDVVEDKNISLDQWRAMR